MTIKTSEVIGTQRKKRYRPKLTRKPAAKEKTFTVSVDEGTLAALLTYQEVTQTDNRSSALNSALTEVLKSRNVAVKSLDSFLADESDEF